MIPALNTVVAVAVIAASAGAASGAWLNGLRWEAKHEHELAQMYQAGVAALEAEQERNRAARERYVADVGRLNRQPPRIVRVCPDGAAGVPAAGPAAGVAGIRAGEDLGPVLRGCLDELYRIRALSGT